MGAPVNRRGNKDKIDFRRSRIWLWSILFAAFLFACGYFLYNCNQSEREDHPSDISEDRDAGSSFERESAPDEGMDATPSGMVMGEFKLYFGNEDFNSTLADCDEVFPVYRRSRDASDLVTVALQELLEGPSAEEQNQGYYTSLNPGVSLLGIRREGKTLYPDFSRSLEEDVAGSCRTMAIRSQIKETLLQFDDVEEVVILVEGRPGNILQP